MAARRIHVPATLGAEGLASLRSSVHAALGADDRAIVLHGDSDTFCLGADLAAVLAGVELRSQAESFAALLTDLINSSKPVIAEVSGRAVGGGVGLVAAADLVVASDQATFGLTEALFGGVPAIVAPMLLRRMSAAKVILWTISSETWNAADARTAGLVDVCVPAHTLERTTTSWVRRLGRAVPEAVVSIKRHVNQAARLAAEDGVQVTSDRFRDPEVLRRVKAFVEQGTAPWLKAE